MLIPVLLPTDAPPALDGPLPALARPLKSDPELTNRVKKAGVGRRFRPPPNSGQSLVRKSYRCAMRRPPICSGMPAAPPLERNDMRIMQYGTSCAGTVKNQIMAF